MCLNLRVDSDKPWNRTKIRYKIVISIGGTFIAPYEGTCYKRRAWNEAELCGDPTGEGFHVFVTKKGALHQNYICGYRGQKRKVMRVQVDGFLKSGTWAEKKSETWKRMRFLGEAKLKKNKE